MLPGLQRQQVRALFVAVLNDWACERNVVSAALNWVPAAWMAAESAQLLADVLIPRSPLAASLNDVTTTVELPSSFITIVRSLPPRRLMPLKPESLAS